MRYGGVVAKVWFKPQGLEPTEAEKAMEVLQQKTAQHRIDELEQRTAGAVRRAKKKKERKQRQKAAKRAGQAELARREQQPDAAQAATQAQQLGQQHAQRPAEQRLAEQHQQVEAFFGRKQKDA